MKITPTFVNDIRHLITAARTTIARGVDLIQVHTNFEIGRRIVQEEQRGQVRASYGKEIIQALARQLTHEFGKGFSYSNLKSMRQFHLLYNERISQTASGQLVSPPKSQTASGQFAPNKKGQAASSSSRIAQTGSAQYAPDETTPAIPPRPFTLSWSHYVFLLTVKNPDERSFYEIEATNENWNLRELKRQYNSGLYERLALSRDKAGIRKLAHEGQIVSHVNDVLKEPLVLEFLGLDASPRYSESDLETAIITQLERFLLELGKGFLFSARQHRFTFDGDHYFVDLVFYHRLLRCHVLIDLKLGKITHQDLGQMQMYVNYFDRYEKTDAENPTVGIILCKQKNKAMVEITLPKNANIHAREYQLYLPSKKQLQQKLLHWAQDHPANRR